MRYRIPRIISLLILIMIVFGCITKEDSDPNIDSNQPVDNTPKQVLTKENAKIAGRVLQNQSGATIELFQGRSVKSTTIDNVDGYFQLSDITPGTYRLVVNSEQYAQYNALIKVEEGHSYEFGIVVLALKTKKSEDTIPSIYDHFPEDKSEKVYLPPDKYNAGSAPLYVSVSFDRPMDRESVEKAFTITPPVQGGYFSWFQNTKRFNPLPPEDADMRGKQSFVDSVFVTNISEASEMSMPSANITTFSTMKTFTYYFPKSGCFTDTTYTIKIAQTAVDTAGTPLDSALDFSFKTVQSQQTYDDIQMKPNNGEDWVALLAPQGIKLIFPKRMNEASVEANVKVNLVAKPIFIWKDFNEVNIYTGGSFIPDTTYIVAIPGATLDLAGNPLGKDKALSFATSPVRVQTTNPQRGSFGVRPNATINLNFNTYMDRTSFAGLLTLEDFDGNPVSGTINYHYYAKKSYPPDTTWYLNQIVFTPSFNLKKNTPYALKLKPGAKDLHGKPMKTDYRLEFITMP